LHGQPGADVKVGCSQFGVPVTAPGRPGETPEQRDDRNLVDLLQELRVATLGVQVLFGFLLGLPFTVRFSHLHAWQRWLYVAVMMLSSTSVILLVAPVAYHRLLFRRHQLGYLLRAANVLAVGGMITVALAVSGAVLLVTSYVEPGMPAVVLAAIVGALFAGLWFALPVGRRKRLADYSSAPSPGEAPP
jgi:hypothetical protein